METKYKIIILTLLLSLLSGCVNYSREAGVENLWRDKQNFTNGKTNTQQVLKALGPPSQVLALNKKTIYYYLKEQVTTASAF